MFETFETSVILRRKIAGYTSPDGIRYDEGHTDVLVKCMFYDGGDISLGVHKGGAVNLGQEQQGDATMVTRDISVNWQEMTDTSVEVLKDNLRYRIMSYQRRPDDWSILVLKKII